MFEKILQTNLINFIIVLMTLVWIFKKAKLSDLINNLADNVKNNIQNNVESLNLAKSNYDKAKSSIKDTQKLKQEILLKAQNLILQEIEKIKKQTIDKKNELENITQDKKIIDTQSYKDKAVSEIYDASINLAKDEVIKLLNGKDSKKLHKKIIDNSINELDKLEKSCFGGIL